MERRKNGRVVRSHRAKARIISPRRFDKMSKIGKSDSLNARIIIIMLVASQKSFLLKFDWFEVSIPYLLVLLQDGPLDVQWNF